MMKHFWKTAMAATVAAVIAAAPALAGKATLNLVLVVDGLRPDDVVLLLTSGELGGLIRAIPQLVETKYPR